MIMVVPIIIPLSVSEILNENRIRTAGALRLFSILYMISAPLVYFLIRSFL